MENKGKRKFFSHGRHAAARDSLVDRLSNVPDEVAHQILSFLQITDLTCFGCVSKRCRELYLSTPSLKFDGFSRELLQSYDQRSRLWSYLDRYFLRRGVNKIDHFHFHWELHYANQKRILQEDERFRLEKWIYNAIRCNVEVLDINIESRYGQVPSLPPCDVLLCGSLKSLSVRLYGKTLQTPSLASFSNLECLKLEGGVVVDEGLFKWISCSCKCIKELSLISVSLRKALSLESVYLINKEKSLIVAIESSSLESLCIEKVDMHHLHITCEKLTKLIIDWTFWRVKYLNICAPNLNNLTWTGSLVNQRDLGTLECLEEANICLLPKPDQQVFVSEILSCLSSATVITVNKETTMALFKGGSIPLLENVCYLCFHIQDFLDTLVPAMTSFLGGICKLKTLIIKSDPFFRDPKADSHGYDMGYWKLQNPVFMNQLKEVTIELSHGSNGFEFAIYILDHAQNLKKMTLVHSPQQSDAMSKLNKSRMASNIKPDFQVDLERGKRTGRRIA